MSFTIGDCVDGLPSKGAGRSNWGIVTDGSDAIAAVVQCIQELTESLELEELKYATPIPPSTSVLALTAGNPIVPISTLLGTIPGNAAYPQFQSQENIYDITDVYTFWMWFAPGTNTAGRTLSYRRVTTVDMYTWGVTSNVQNNYGVAPPVYYTRFGSNLEVGPAPDQNYNYFVRVKLRHPFPSSAFADQIVFAPDSWMEMIQYDAITKLSQNEGITTGSVYSTAMNFLKMRGADPASLRQMQMLRDERHSSRSLSVRMGRYSHG
jgi:hypothetical protein